jgi:hypothetical protein
MELVRVRATFHSMVKRKTKSPSTILQVSQGFPMNSKKTLPIVSGVARILTRWDLIIFFNDNSLDPYSFFH